MDKKRRDWTPRLESYEDVKTFLSHADVQAVSPENSKIFEWIQVHAPRFAQTMGHVVFLRNGDDHRRLRHIYQHLLNQTHIRRVTKNFETRIHAVLQAVTDKTQFDFVDAFTRPLVLGFILDLVGLEPQWVQRIGPLIHLVASGFDFLHPPDKWKEIETAFAELEAILQERVLQAARQPDDPIYEFLASDAWHSETEKTDNLMFLIGAAYETTNSALAGSLVQLSNEPQFWQKLQDETWAPRILEECLRIVSPVKTVVRMPMADVIVGDTTFAQGRLVQASLHKANARPEETKDGKAHIQLKSDMKHLAFGYGAHYCAGAPLARIELQTALVYLSQHFHAPVIQRVEYSETAFTQSILHAWGGLEAR